MSEATIFDADVHLSYSLNTIADYCDDTYSAEKLQTLDRGPWSHRPSSGWAGKLGGRVPGGVEISDAETTDEVLCKDFGIDHPICNVMTGLSSVSDTDLAVHMAPACNNLLLDRFLDEKEHFYGIASVAPQRPDKAAEEIDRVAGEDQIVGILLYNAHAGLPLGDVKYDPIYEAADDNDLAVAYHGGAINGFVSQFPIQNYGHETFMSVHTLSHAYQSMSLVCSLIENGTFVKFPDLNFVILESGIGWVPYMMYRLNKEYAIRRSSVPLLERQPEDYIRESMYFATQPIGEPNNPRDMNEMIKLVGPESIMFSSDYPHWDFDHPDALDKHLRSFSAEERKQVLTETPAEAFGVDL